MKKTIRPPENWQDFETLCKKLFGEMWGCPNTIKKNGRSGQTQCGIDIYGIPKGESDYWGVQCKGKDNYTNAKLTENEITEEIEKALTFQPELNTFVFATTAVKDAKIEKFIRIKDVESRAKGNFQISLYCWEDIVDLIEENRNTFNWYVNEVQYKDKFDVEIQFSVNIFKPTFLKTITEYKLQPQITDPTEALLAQLSAKKNVVAFDLLSIAKDMHPLFGGTYKKNHAWCSFETSIINTGNQVLEDWEFWLEFSDDAHKIDDGSPKGLDIIVHKDAMKLIPTLVYEEDNSILYQPRDNSPLIQKKSRTFESYCLPKIGSEEIKIHWELLARDFNREGDFIIKIEPEYEIKHKVEYTEIEDLVGIDEEIDWYVTEKRQANE